MPRLDLCAARLYRLDRPLLSERKTHAAAAKAMLHFGRGALTDSITCNDAYGAVKRLTGDSSLQAR